METRQIIRRALIPYLKLPTLLLTVALVSGATTATAAIKTWARTTGGSWATPASWSPNGAPAAGDAVIINTDQTANITAVPVITLSNLTVSGNCTLASATTGNTLTITNSLSIAAGKTLTLGVSSARIVFTLAASATATISGNLAFDAGTTVRNFTVNGTFIVNPGGRVYDPVMSPGSVFILNSGATLKIGSPGGISTSTTTNTTVAINFAGGYAYGTGANYFYIGTSNQVTGNGLPATVSSLSISNAGPAGTNFVRLSSNVTVSSNLSVSAGGMDLSTNTANRSAVGGTFALANGASLLVGGASNFPTGYSTVSLGGTSAVDYYAAGAQTVSAQTYGDVVFSGAGAKSMGAGTSVAGKMSIAPTGSAIASVGAGLNLPVGSLDLGGIGRPAGTWGSTTATLATYHDNTYFGPTTGYLTVSTDTRTVPTVSSWPTASAITYGQTLASSTLSGGSASVPGSFTFTTPSTAPNAGTASQSVTFTPANITNYTTVVGAASVTVNKANPSVTTWPTASAITYGQTLASSTLSGGVATPAGSFAFTTPSTAPGAGTAAQGVTFTPADTANYNTTSGTVSVTVGKANPSVTTWPTASAITYGQTLASSTLSGGVAAPAGSFAFTTPSTAPGAGTAAQGVTYTPTDTANYNTTSGTVSVTVGKANPSVTTWPTATAITYGQTLASSILSGGVATPAGSFAFTTPSTAPNAGTSSQGVTYTPTDTANYNTASGTVSVTVGKANPSVTTWPTASAITYGQTLAASTLSGGVATPAGSFAFTTPSTAPNAGTSSQGVTYTPTDTTNYNTSSGTVSVTVGKANPSVTTWPTASAITYGQTLAASTLSGGVATPAGSFAFTTPSTAPNAGTSSQGVTYTPTDTTNYNTSSGTVSVTVGKANPSVTTWPTASAITYGQTLASSTLSGGVATPAGSFAFTTPSTAPNAGTSSQGVTYTPTDTANYNTASSTVSVTVGKANPSVTTWPTSSAITYGQTLTSSTLSGGVATPVGSFAFTTPATAPSAGTSSQGVTYTPTDTANYNTSSGTVSVTVGKANPSVTTWPTASPITYGQTLAASTLSGGVATPAGSFAFTTPSTAPNAGTASQGVTYTPTDTANYNSASGTVSVTVGKANPSVTTWPAASAITYGQTLTASTLSGGAATPAGSFAFTAPSTAPGAGTASQGVTYTPTDMANYNTSSGTVSVTVGKANPNVTTWPTASAITYGQTLAASTLSGGVATPAGSFAFTTPSTAPNAGTSSQVVTFTPTDTANYDTASAPVSVTVGKANPNVTTWPTASAIAYGQTLVACTLSGGVATPAGSFAFTTPTTAPNAGTTSQGVTYTPTDTANYNTASGNVSVTVGKANPSVATWPTASAITYGQALAASTLSGGAATPSGSFAFTTPSTAPNAGTSSQGVTYTPTDTNNFVPASSTVTIAVNPKTLTVSGLTADSKAYDGNTSAALNISSAALVGVVSSDSVVLNTSSASGAFADANAGVGKSVTVSGLTISGAEASNYLVTQPSTSADINPAGLTVSADNKTRAYRASNPPLTASYAGFVGGEDTNVLSGAPDLTTSADTNSPVGTYPIAIAVGSLTSLNYTFSFTNGSLVVTPHALTVTADDKSRAYGVGNPVLTGTLTGVQAGDNITASYSTSASTNSPVGTHSIVPSLNDPDNKLTNYSVISNNGTLTISPAALIVAANNASRAYGQPNPNFTTTIWGYVNGDDVSDLSGTLVLTTPAQTNSLPGNYPIVPSGFLSTNYSITYSNGTLTVTTTNQPPVIDPIANAVLLPEQPFSFELQATDPNGNSHAFTLDPGAPAGAVITTVGTNSMFRWRPTRDQASTTNLITVRVTDNGVPPMSAVESFTIIVLDYLEMIVASTNLESGQSVTIPIFLASSDGVTNFDFNLQWPASHLTNPVVVATASALASASLLDQGTNLAFSFRVAPGQVLQGTQQIAQLTFSAITNEYSAFVSLPINSPSAAKPNGSSYTNYIAPPARIAVVEGQPLLWAFVTENSARDLTLYGRLGLTYELQYSTNLGIPNTWSLLWSYVQTNGAITIRVDSAHPKIFYRTFRP